MRKKTMGKKKDKRVDAYILSSSKESQIFLKKIREIIHKLVPSFIETISYGIPTIDFEGEHLIHFAAFKKHIGFFPTSSPIPFFKKELIGYKTSRGTIQFPLDKKLPIGLIIRIVKFRVKEVKQKISLK